MIRLRSLSPRRQKFAEEFVRLAGRNATAAARIAGYGRLGAKVRAHHLLRNEAVLVTIAALPGGLEALARCRSPATRWRAALLATATIGEGVRPIVPVDTEAAALRGYIARHAHHFDGFGCQFRVPTDAKHNHPSGLTGAVTGSAIRSTP